MGHAMDEPDLIAESRRLCRDLEQRLPRIHIPHPDATSTTASGVTVTAKIPSKLAAVIGSLAWRAHDFAILACELFEGKRVIPGAVITRSLMETTALFYLVQRKTAQAVSARTLVSLDEFLVRCMSGSRLGNGDPDAPSVLTAVQALDKEPGCDGYAAFYASLCEFAHPNALGSFYAYSSFDSESRAIWFGHNCGLTNGRDVAFAVVFALEVLLEFLKKVGDMTPVVMQLARETYPNDKAV
jgi:hypothetical protein